VQSLRSKRRVGENGFHRRAVEGKIYVFSIGDEAYVKRLRRTAGAVVMISDNREMFPPEEVPQESALCIYGRVMWAGRSL
jgi:phage repressor protein C with HTH and peptisase S24 domain